jgi:hypothetical protein
MQGLGNWQARFPFPAGGNADVDWKYCSKYCSRVPEMFACSYMLLSTSNLLDSRPDTIIHTEERVYLKLREYFVCC